MRVYLIRHGHYENAYIDATQQLSKQGREDITRVAGFLSLFEKPRPKHIYHSPKLRAVQTAAMIAEAWQIEHVYENPDLLPNADPRKWEPLLNSTSADIALVGHLPSLGLLAGQLICGNESCEAVRMHSGAVLCLERGEATWTVQWHLHPALFYDAD